MSREFKSTLEREIGLDEVASSTNYINKSALYADEKQQASVDPSKFKRCFLTPDNHELIK